MFDDKADLQGKFWSALKHSPFVMLGVDGARDGHAQPMTAQQDENTGNTLWFFTTKDNTLIGALAESNRAIATFSGKGHDLFATIHGTLREDNDRTIVDRLWNSHVEAWYEGGKSDPNLALLRLDPEKATIWKGGSFVGAALDQLLGRDPKETYKDNMATVSL